MKPETKRFVALLRGINVGGNGLIRMDALKREFEACGYTGVATYIQSGNVVFGSSDQPEGIAGHLETALSGAFGMDIRAVVIEKDAFAGILRAAPSDWNGNDALRRYIAFVRPPVTAGDVLPFVKPKAGIDTVTAGNGVLYLSTALSGLTKSGFTKLVGTPVYRDLTMRNYSTVGKLNRLLET
jgi:uncharacterized protein (DUF1697 family)